MASAEEKEGKDAPEEKEDSGPPKWIPLLRDYGEEAEKFKVKLARTRDHPLLIESKQKKDKKQQPKDEKREASAEDDPLSAPTPKPVPDDPLMGGGFADPLRAAAAAPSASPSARAPAPVLDPLTRAAAAAAAQGGDEPKDSNLVAALLAQESQAVDFEPWKDKMAKILTTYTTNKRMPVSAQFLDDDVLKEPGGGAGGGEGKEEKKEAVAVKQNDKARSRLEQLEVDPESEKAKMMMSQKEYIAHIEAQHDRLKHAWDSGERVLALKIAIQCAKLLNDTTVPQFYPSMYVLLTSVLDTFGDLVFERIKRKGTIIAQKGKAIAGALDYAFVASDVSATAKETCRNWFYKTACIRELLPRLYIELALIKSYRFLGEEPFPDILLRIAKSIRGIGDPLTATFARAFLATKCNDLWGSFRDPKTPKVGKAWFMPENYQRCLQTCFEDFLFTFSHYKADKFQAISAVRDSKVELDVYVDLFSPAVQWVLQNVGYRSTEDSFFAFLREYKEKCNNSMVLMHMLSSFDAKFVSKHALSMTTLIKEADPNEFTPKSRLYLVLGRALVKSSPPKDQRLPILNDIWKVVTKIQDPNKYIEISEVFVQYLLINFTSREVNIFLKDVVKHVKKDQAYKGLQKELHSICCKSIQYSNDILRTLAMDNFLPVYDLLEKKSRGSAGKVVLEAFAKAKVPTSDPVIIHTLFDVARSLHDSVDSLSFEDERRQIADLIIDFIRLIDFDRDLDKQLNTYVDCRQAFSNLDSVIRELVVRTALLTMKAHSFMKGKHNKKTAAFVKACLAYCHITIPSLDDTFSRLYLLLQCGEVALVNQMITQGEGFLKAAISLIPEVPAAVDPGKKQGAVEEQLAAYVLDFASFILLFPGHPSNGPFYLVKGLLNAVSAFPPWKKPSGTKTRVFLGLLQLFCTYYQRNFPYHIDRVDSNDSLYGGDPKYTRALYSFLDTLVTGILQQLDAIGKIGDIVSKKEQGELALDFVNVLISSMQMNPQSATLVVKLYQLAKKNGAVEKRYLESTLTHIQAKDGNWYQDIASKIVNS